MVLRGLTVLVTVLKHIHLLAINSTTTHSWYSAVPLALVMAFPMLSKRGRVHDDGNKRNPDEASADNITELFCRMKFQPFEHRVFFADDVQGDSEKKLNAKHISSDLMRALT